MTICFCICLLFPPTAPYLLQPEGTYHIDSVECLYDGRHPSHLDSCSTPSVIGAASTVASIACQIGGFFHAARLVCPRRPLPSHSKAQPLLSKVPFHVVAFASVHPPTNRGTCHLQGSPTCAPQLKAPSAPWLGRASQLLKHEKGAG